jgi:hypothetical protein
MGYVAAVVCLLDRGAGAASLDDGLVISWRPSGDCPSYEVFLGDVGRLTAGAAETVPATVHLETFQDALGAWQASMRIDLRDGHQERHFSGATCAALVSGAAIIVASSIERHPAEAPAASAAPKPVDVAPRPALFLALAMLADRGTLPAWPALGASAAVGWQRQIGAWRLRMMVEGGFFPAQSSDPSPEGVSGRFSLLAGAIRSCATFAPFEYLDLGACLGGGLEWMRGRAVGPPEEVNGYASLGWWASWAAAPLSLGASLPIFPWSVGSRAMSL